MRHRDGNPPEIQSLCDKSVSGIFDNIRYDNHRDSNMVFIH